MYLRLAVVNELEPDNDFLCGPAEGIGQGVLRQRHPQLVTPVPRVAAEEDDLDGLSRSWQHIDSVDGSADGHGGRLPRRQRQVDVRGDSPRLPVPPLIREEPLQGRMTAFEIRVLARVEHQFAGGFLDSVSLVKPVHRHTERALVPQTPTLQRCRLLTPNHPGSRIAPKRLKLAMRNLHARSRAMDGYRPSTVDASPAKRRCIASAWPTSRCGLINSTNVAKAISSSSSRIATTSSASSAAFRRPSSSNPRDPMSSSQTRRR